MSNQSTTRDAPAIEAAPVREEPTPAPDANNFPREGEHNTVTRDQIEFVVDQQVGNGRVNDEQRSGRLGEAAELFSAKRTAHTVAAAMAGDEHHVRCSRIEQRFPICFNDRVRCRIMQ